MFLFFFPTNGCNYVQLLASECQSNTPKNTPTHEKRVHTSTAPLSILHLHPCYEVVAVKQIQGQEDCFPPAIQVFQFPLSEARKDTDCSREAPL